MAVLVTGGAGYIGSHMVWALLDAGERVVVIDRLSTGFRWAVADQARFYYGDIADTARLNQIFHENDIDLVMHFAGSISVPESVTQPLDYYRNNCENTRNLIAACIDNGIRKLVFSSTAAVYGAQDTSVPVVEESDLKPANPYGRSKLMAEQILADAAAAYDFSYVALRFFNVAGSDLKGRVGPSNLGATNLIKVVCEAAAGRRDGVDIYGDDYPTTDGTGVRDYIHVDDLTLAHVKAMQYLRGDGTPAVVNCGYGHGYSVLDVVNTARKLSAYDFLVRVQPRRAGDIAMMVANSSRARGLLGWAPCNDDLSLIIRSGLMWEAKLQERQPRSTDDAIDRLNRAGYGVGR